jgi:hypothetical protein
MNDGLEREGTVITQEQRNHKNEAATMYESATPAAHFVREVSSVRNRRLYQATPLVAP